MLKRLGAFVFPPKCVLCGKLLQEDETDLCHNCRKDAPVFTKEKINFSFIARWTAVWYYKDNVRLSLLRYKFSRRRNYAPCYGRLLAMKLQNSRLDDFDVLTWVPISRLRFFQRGFDQVEILASAVAFELGIPAVKVLKKIRHTPPQSRLKSAAQRRANILGAYRVINGDAVQGKRVLLLDDIITTGSTVSECARMLILAGAGEVRCAAMAVAPYDKKNKK